MSGGCTDIDFDEDRNFQGGLYGGLTIALMFGAWRLAVTIDTAANVLDWFWLPFEWALLQFSFFLLVLPNVMLGGWLFDRQYDKRWQSALGCSVIAFLYGWMMFVFDLLGMEKHGAFGVPFANFYVLVFAGLVGGIYAHRVWFASPSFDANEEG